MAYPLLRKRGTYFPFQIFKEFLKVQALKDQQVEAGKSKTAFALHQKRDDHFMKGDENYFVLEQIICSYEFNDKHCRRYQ